MIDIINYGVRAFVLLIGLGILSGLIDLGIEDNYTRYAMGTIITLFGIYRIIVYSSIKKRRLLEEQLEKNS